MFSHGLMTWRRHMIGMLWRVLQEYGINEHLLMAINSLNLKVCVHVIVNNQSHFMWVLVFGRVCFAIYPFYSLRNWMDKLGRTDECITFEKCKTSWLLFADDLVLLASSESGLQHAFNGFTAACDIELE